MWACPFCSAFLPEEGEGLEALLLDPGEVFCPRCGAQLYEESYEKEGAPTPLKEVTTCSSASAFTLL